MEYLIDDGENVYIVGNEKGFNVPCEIHDGVVTIYGHTYELPKNTRHYKKWKLRRIT